MELTSKQRRAVDYVTSTNMRQFGVLIKGSAGCGKTLTGTRIAGQIQSQVNLSGEPAKVAVITFTNSLVHEIESFLPSDLDIGVSTFHSNPLVREILSVANCGPQTSASRFYNNYTNVDLKYGIEFYEDEFAMMFGNSITSWEEYRIFKRIGRKLGLREGEREHIWSVFMDYKKWLKENNKVDYNDVSNQVIENYHLFNPDDLYDCLIVDEVQDFSKSQLTAMRRLVKPEGETCETRQMMIVMGDMAQSIYQRGLTWKSVGLKFHSGNVFELDENFRNSKQIAEAANCLLEAEKRMNIADAEDYTAQEKPSRDGYHPIVVYCNSIEQQTEYVVKQVMKIRKEHPDQNIAIIARYGITKSEGLKQIADELMKENECSCTKSKSGSLERMQHTGLCLKTVDQKRFKKGGDKICLGTMHSSKGVEYDNVFIVDAMMMLYRTGTASLIVKSLLRSDVYFMLR
ncbi:MAG: AAA family ATPase [Candidatus Ancillula sp.]|jgi:superfamily I DNA/RNA helicase|nr:AAA family ATPase [Candidatus Ancillula sp.]